MTRLFPLVLLAFAAACTMHRPPIGPQPPHEPIPPAPSARAPAQTSTPLLDMQGATIGQVSLEEDQAGVLIRIAVEPGKLSAGEHGMFLYDRAECAAPVPAIGAMTPGLAPSTPAASTPYAPYAPYDTRGLQPGDLPALVVPPEGPVMAEMLVRPVTLAGTSRTRMALRDDDGAALIVEDKLSPPRARAACALIGAPAQAP